MPKEMESNRKVIDDDDVHEDFIDEDTPSKKIQYDFEDDGDEPDD